MVQVSFPSSRPSLPSRPSRPLRHAASLRVASRLLLGAVASAAALAALFPGAAVAGAGAPPPVRDEDRSGDHLVVTVRDAGDGRNGTYELYCHPEGGSHPDARGACGALDRNARWGRDTFASVPDGSVCTLQYGGPATAHVTGSWAGRRVDATYSRANGCEIERWNRLVPFLPDLGSRAVPAGWPRAVTAGS
ncbi:SSI family serine proteinase inhibitor [Streptomyces sp. NPDC018610]|uniref:SSI family serine proteinase inhibitor n=1 Tax=Streptomyces sp. NPDC018610 TaxID=3365049 RepID=UPI0037965860